ncbi:hypothetical protein [Nocardia iowensis]|uniref:Outer membrane channel protein CpnT-like N-terminal domain-containing protein n=1 Tax=Nocardia iowensis TaxID=204891 RepID=A0ABX8S0G5_NOCIO|nr:hypothetical protein [Nocardia iowensis]QXN94692.1 hypothetical protein KV110_17530 [Nocardia iowensis]
MPIEIPSEVILFLNCCGVPYPDVDEDQVRELARHVRDFSSNVGQTQESATIVIRDMGSVYSGHSYEQLVTAWAAMNTQHMAELQRTCAAVAKAIDVTADVITAVKVVVLAELAALAASYATALAASVVTYGASAALSAAITAAARRLCQAMQQMLIAYILAEVISRAIEPLEDAVGRMVDRFAYGALQGALGVPASTTPLHIEADEIGHYADVLDQHAAEMIKHGADLADKLARLDYVSPSGRELAVPEQLPSAGLTPPLAAEPRADPPDRRFGSPPHGQVDPTQHGARTSGSHQQNEIEPGNDNPEYAKEPTPGTSRDPRTSTPPRGDTSALTPARTAEYGSALMGVMPALAWTESVGLSGLGIDSGRTSSPDTAAVSLGENSISTEFRTSAGSTAAAPQFSQTGPDQPPTTPWEHPRAGFSGATNTPGTPQSRAASRPRGPRIRSRGGVTTPWSRPNNTPGVASTTSPLPTSAEAAPDRDRDRAPRRIPDPAKTVVSEPNSTPGVKSMPNEARTAATADNELRRPK